MLNNCNNLCRIDEMRAFDGTFSEGAALNAVAWTGVLNPTIMWTYHLYDNQTMLDEFFQQHLLMNVYPMAPMPKNDHSITPGSLIVQQAYEDYAPLFNAMHGARWLLTAHPATLNRGDIPGVNVLTAGAGASDVKYLAQIMLVPTETEVFLSLNLPDTNLKTVAVSVLHPAGAGPVKLGFATRDSKSKTWGISVPLVRGCAVALVSVE